MHVGHHVGHLQHAHECTGCVGYLCRACTGPSCDCTHMHGIACAGMHTAACAMLLANACCAGMLGSLQTHVQLVYAQVQCWCAWF
jgi:hypothetical protein